jgi:hypothetical protein
MGVLKDFDVSKLRRETAVIGNEPHNVVIPGLNYMGFCHTPNCTVRNKCVVAQRGAGQFIINDDIVSGRTACPMCRQQFDLEALVLYQCKAKATLLRHVEETSEYSTSGQELLVIGAKKTAGNATAPLPLQSDALLTFTVSTQRADTCSVM